MVFIMFISLANVTTNLIGAKFEINFVEKFLGVPPLALVAVEAVLFLLPAIGVGLSTASPRPQPET